MQPQPAGARPARQGGHPGRGRHAARVQHRLGLGRGLDGNGRDARVARLARGHRRLDRARSTRAPLRRARLPRRLRQDHSRRGHGSLSARSAGARAVQRLDRPRALSRARRDHPGRVRGNRSARRRDDERSRAARARERRVSRRGRLRRPVHGQHHVDGARLPRDQPRGPERHPRASSRQGQSGRGDGAARDGARPQRHPSLADRDARIARERGRVGRGHRRLDERRAPRPRDRTRARDPVRARGLRPDRGAHTGRGEPQAGRAVRRDGRPRGRRRRTRRA